MPGREYGGRVRRNGLTSLVTAVAVFGLIRGAFSGALWDPHEVEVAELSRRIALNLLGAGGLEVPGADNGVPIRADLGRGELPFTSAALGFKLFGLSEWAGRLPLTLWALLGLAAVHAALSRLWDRRAALYAVLVLATTPLYFLQARSLLGDAVTLASFAIAWSGLSVALLARAQSPASRGGFALLGVAGLYAGFWCRGLIPSVAVPALSVGLVALLTRPARERLATFLALATTLAGAAALLLGVLALDRARAGGEYSIWVGSALSAPGSLPTFQAPLTALLHACFPWSAAAPLAAASLWRRRDRDAASDGAAQAGCAAAALGLGASLAAAAWSWPLLGAAVVPGVACLAVLVAAALRELERAELPSIAPALVVAALIVVLGFDLRVYPAKALAGFGLVEAALPEALEAGAAKLWTWSSLVLAVVVVLCLLERETSPRAFERAEYRRVLAALKRVWDGNLVFAALVTEAALVGILLLAAISERTTALPQLDAFGVLTRKLVAFGAVAVPLAVLVPLAALSARDAARVFFHGAWLGSLRGQAPTRPQGVLLAFAAVGLVASFGFYPAVASQVAPKEVFDRYDELRRADEPLGVLGEERAALRYRNGSSAQFFPDAAAAFEWLAATRAEGPRRWLLLRKAELAELNARFRERHWGNLPILDARSSEVLLASNRLGPKERDESPLAEVVLDAAPRPQHPVRAILGAGQLEVLGWSLMSAAGRLETSVLPATRYRFVVYYRVLAPIEEGWQSFVHLDGLQRRFNADHELLNGKYPLSHWRPGDVMADATELLLEPNFSPGAYRVYFGLYRGERRLEVTEGPEEDDRIVAGTLQIR